MEPISEDVRRFLQTQIASVEQLEVLRVIAEDPQREFSDDELRRLAQVSAEAIHPHLRTMNERGLLRTRSADTRMYAQYGPHTTKLAEQIGQLLEVYRRHPVTMIRLVYKRSTAALDDFADAFRIRKKEP